MSDPIEQRLREIEERAKAATEGPWTVWIDGHSVIDASKSRTATSAGGAVYSQANATFIAAARTDIPWLLAFRLREARTENAKLTEQLVRTKAVALNYLNELEKP